MRYYEIRLVESIMLRELSDKIKQATRDRFKQDDPTLTDQQLNFYLDRWDRYSATFPPASRDITRLKFAQVEQLVDTAETRAELKGGARPDQPAGAAEDTLYDQNNLVILRGDIREKCITYGRGYSWCISRTDASNMFYSYRMRKNEPMFYFVFDRDRPNTDVWHAVVIYIDNQNTYHVATANNPGDVAMTWEQIVAKQPKLRTLQGLFKPQPLTAEEQTDYAKYGEPVDDDTYAVWSITEQYKYIRFGHQLTSTQQTDTPKELIGVYAKLVPLHVTAETFNRLNGSDRKAVHTSQLEAVQRQGGLIRYIENPSEAVQLAAVQQNGYAVQFINNPSEAVQLAAVERDPGAIDYIIDAGITPSEEVQAAADRF